MTNMKLKINNNNKKSCPMRKLRRGLLELAIAEAKTPCPLKGKMSARGSFVQSHNNTNRKKKQDTYIGMMETISKRDATSLIPVLGSPQMNIYGNQRKQV